MLSFSPSTKADILDEATIYESKLRWLDWILLGGYLPTLNMDYVAMSKDMAKTLPQLYYVTMKISYDLGFIAIEIAMAT